MTSRKMVKKVEICEDDFVEEEFELVLTEEAIPGFDISVNEAQAQTKFVKLFHDESSGLIVADTPPIGRNSDNVVNSVFTLLNIWSLLKNCTTLLPVLVLSFDSLESYEGMFPVVSFLKDFVTDIPAFLQHLLIWITQTKENEDAARVKAIKTLQAVKKSNLIDAMEKEICSSLLQHIYKSIHGKTGHVKVLHPLHTVASDWLELIDKATFIDPQKFFGYKIDQNFENKLNAHCSKLKGKVLEWLNQKNFARIALEMETLQQLCKHHNFPIVASCFKEMLNRILQFFEITSQLPEDFLANADSLNDKFLSLSALERHLQSFLGDGLEIKQSKENLLSKLKEKIVNHFLSFHAVLYEENIEQAALSSLAARLSQIQNFFSSLKEYIADFGEEQLSNFFQKTSNRCTELANKISESLKNNSKDWDQAIKSLNALTRLHPSLSSGMKEKISQLKGAIEEKKKEGEERRKKEEKEEKEINLEKTIKKLNNLQLESNESQEALWEYEEICKKLDNLKQKLTMKALNNWKQGKTDKAIEKFKRLEELSKAGFHVSSLEDAHKKLKEQILNVVKEKIQKLRNETKEEKSIDLLGEDFGETNDAPLPKGFISADKLHQIFTFLDSVNKALKPVGGDPTVSKALNGIETKVKSTVDFFVKEINKNLSSKNPNFQHIYSHLSQLKLLRECDPLKKLVNKSFDQVKQQLEKYLKEAEKNCKNAPSNKSESEHEEALEKLNRLTWLDEFLGGKATAAFQSVHSASESSKESLGKVETLLKEKEFAELGKYFQSTRDQRTNKIALERVKAWFSTCVGNAEDLLSQLTFDTKLDQIKQINVALEDLKNSQKHLSYHLNHKGFDVKQKLSGKLKSAFGQLEKEVITMNLRNPDECIQHFKSMVNEFMPLIRQNHQNQRDNHSYDHNSSKDVNEIEEKLNYLDNWKISSINFFSQQIKSQILYETIDSGLLNGIFNKTKDDIFFQTLFQVLSDSVKSRCNSFLDIAKEGNFKRALSKLSHCQNSMRGLTRSQDLAPIFQQTELEIQEVKEKDIIFCLVEYPIQ